MPSLLLIGSVIAESNRPALRGKNEDVSMPSVPHEFNSDYVNALREGNPAIEAHFVDYFSPILLRALRRKVRCADQARDLRQETFLRVLSAVRRGREVRKPDRFAAYVMSVCNHIVCETYRQQRRFVGLPTLETEPAVDLPSAYALMLAAETRSKVGRVLSQLSASERSVLQDVFLDEQDKDDVCRSLGVSRTYLRVVLFRAKNRFRKRMEGNALTCPAKLLSLSEIRSATIEQNERQN